MKEFFNKWFDYNKTVNEKYISFIEENNIQDPFPSSEISHLLKAHEIWISRIIGDYPGGNLWDVISFNEMYSKNEKFYNLTLEVLRNNELTRVIKYSNTKGEPFENLLTDILYHLLNHSNYHRARVANFLRSINIAPPASDYILYVRENNFI